jgi:cell wall-associated NlpC family hydrolase
LARVPRRPLILALGAVALVVAALGAAALLKDDPADTAVSGSIARGELAGVRDTEASQAFPESGDSTHRSAEDPAAAAAAAAATEDTGPSPGAPSDAEVRRDLRQLERYNRGLKRGGSLGVTRKGDAEAPIGAPGVIGDIVAGGNEIARFPYRLGGGHGSFVDNAYDCSGSVSYALAAAGMLQSPLTSGDLMKWGKPGPGRWMTVYANPGHVYMVVGGLRFDTSGRAGRRGSRWQSGQRPPRGFVARHWPGY